MTFKLLDGCPSIRCDRCDVVVASNASIKHLWRDLEREGWLRIGHNRNLCNRCVEQQEKVPTYENTRNSAVERVP
jgi:hypothetical protein